MYRLEFLPGAVKDLKKLEFVVQKIIKNKLEVLAGNPERLKNDIKTLKGNHTDKYRLRVRNYRIIFQKRDDVLIILIVRIGHRKSVYDIE
ncbi:MAG: type II toxin-antitoxin system RelE/ParE family toxin [Candidatus Riflebacteria bacterium]|jgi:mRNA interferase RelE/StbE|nr:type II toxin-antitoxin system RelE/ParE family toxin [Candidatus Riflebacteria bacterium]